MSFEATLVKHFRTYPLMRCIDFIKLIYQSEFGSHAKIDIKWATEYIEEEYASISDSHEELDEYIGSGLCRVFLSKYFEMGYSAQLLANIFAKSCTRDRATNESLDKKFDVLNSLCQRKIINLSPNAVFAEIENFKRDIKAVSHSTTYRKNYAPHYRVAKTGYVRLLPVLSRIDKDNGGNILFCIDGPAGSGKSYYADLLKEFYGDRCNVFHADDFFLPTNLATDARRAEIGGNIHYERLAELLKAIENGGEVAYQRFDCHTQRYSDCVVHPAQINIIEGVYSAHCSLLAHYDFVVKLNLSPSKQQQRILNRDGQSVLERYNNEWLILEKPYFDRFDQRVLSSDSVLVTLDGDLCDPPDFDQDCPSV